jgi:hypothetical protein
MNICRRSEAQSIRVLVVVLVILTISTGTAARSSASPQWAPAATASIHPGVQTITHGSQCTADFVFTDGASVYIGQAAHCASTGSSTQTNGCTTPVLPVGTAVTVDGASLAGTMVYNSWETMQRLHESDPNVCHGNDFALVKLDRFDVGKVNPSIPHWGGPKGDNPLAPRRSTACTRSATRSFGRESLSCRP